MAVFTLPPEMILFYKQNLEAIEEASLQPDIRRYVWEDEGPRHYLDIDIYGDSAIFTFPRKWQDAIAKVGNDTLMANGILPWAIQWTERDLTEAFRTKNTKRIIRYSADIAHYLGDAHVPLHTTQNYNGQLSGQEGIHRLWETRIPEVESDDYTFWVGRAEYVGNTNKAIWTIIEQSHLMVDTVLTKERDFSQNYPEEFKYSYLKRGKMEKHDYSNDYVRFYSAELNGMVERQLRASVRMIGNFWFTCWVNAGQPDLHTLDEASKSSSAPVHTKNKKDSIKVESQRSTLHKK